MPPEVDLLRWPSALSSPSDKTFTPPDDGSTPPSETSLPFDADLWVEGHNSVSHYADQRAKRIEEIQQLREGNKKSEAPKEGDENIEDTISEDLAEGHTVKLDESLGILGENDLVLFLPSDEPDEDEIHIIAQDSGNSSNHALQDYQMQLMLLEQQNKKRLLMARQELDEEVARAPDRETIKKHLDIVPGKMLPPTDVASGNQTRNPKRPLQASPNSPIGEANGMGRKPIKRQRQDGLDNNSDIYEQIHCPADNVSSTEDNGQCHMRTILAP